MKSGTLRRWCSAAAVMFSWGVTVSAQSPSAAGGGVPLAAPMPAAIPAPMSAPVSTPGLAAAPTAAPTPGVTAAPMSGAIGSEAPLNFSSSPSYMLSDSESRAWGATTALGYDPNFWFSADYLIWFTKNQASPRLVVSVADEAIRGTTTDNQIRALYPSNNRIEFNAQSGVRLTGGFTLPSGLGIDLSGFVMGSISDGGLFSSNGSPSLARAYTRAGDGSQQFSYIAIPGEYAGRVQVFADTQTYGADANVRVDWYKLLADRNDVLLGFRYLQVEESLLISDQANLRDGTVISAVLDVARTRNQYYGAQVGLSSRFLNYKGVSLEMVGKLGIGSVRQEAEIFGQNTLTGQPVEAIGLFAGPFNSGRFVRDQFAGVGELGLNLGYNFTPNFRVVIGYNIIWLSSVVRPGLAFDPVVNDSLLRYAPLGTPADDINRRPNFDFGRSTSDIWVQGLNLGVTLTY